MFKRKDLLIFLYSYPIFLSLQKHLCCPYRYRSLLFSKVFTSLLGPELVVEACLHIFLVQKFPLAFFLPFTESVSLYFGHKCGSLFIYVQKSLQSLFVPFLTFLSKNVNCCHTLTHCCVCFPSLFCILLFVPFKCAFFVEAKQCQCRKSNSENQMQKFE